MGLFKYNEGENVRVPKLNDLSNRLNTLDLDGGDVNGVSGSVFDLDGGDSNG